MGAGGERREDDRGYHTHDTTYACPTYHKCLTEPHLLYLYLYSVVPYLYQYSVVIHPPHLPDTSTEWSIPEGH